MALPEAITYDRAGRVTEVEQELKYVPGALYTVRNMLGVDPDGGGVPDATEIVKGKAELATVAEAVAGVDHARIVTPAGLAAALAAETYIAPKFYKAVITQTGEDAPVVEFSIDNIPETVVWSRNSIGYYVATWSGAWMNNITDTLFMVGGSFSGRVRADQWNTNSVRIKTFDDAGALADGVLYKTAVWVEVYS